MWGIYVAFCNLELRIISFNSNQKSKIVIFVGLIRYVSKKLKIKMK